MPETRLDKLRTRLAENGLAATLRKAFGDHVFRHSASVMLEVESAAARPGRVRLDPDMRMVEVRAAAELPPLGSFLARRRDDFLAMLAAGKRGYFVLRNEAAVGCAWVALSDHHDPRMRERYPVARGEAYHYSWLLAPEERPRGTALVFFRWMLVTLRDQGFTRLFGVIDRDNRASYRVHQRFGYRETGLLIRHIHLFRQHVTLMKRYDGTLGLYDQRLGRHTA